MRYLTYVIYILFWEAFSLGGASYVVFWLHRSGWWFVLGLILSASAYPPSKWKME